MKLLQKFNLHLEDINTGKRLWNRIKNRSKFMNSFIMVERAESNSTRVSLTRIDSKLCDSVVISEYCNLPNIVICRIL